MLKVKKIFGEKKPNLQLEALQRIYNSIIEASIGHERYSEGIIAYAQSVKNLIASWAPSYAAAIDPFIETNNELSELYKNLSTVEIRVAEDIRDCFERFFAVERAAEAYNKSSDLYKDASDNLIYALGDELYEKRTNMDKYEEKKEALQAKIAKARQIKKDVLQEKKNNLSHYINSRDKYNTFKVRRLKHAFTLYSSTLKECAEKEMSIYDRSIEILRGIKDSKALPEKLVEGIESTMVSKEEGEKMNEGTEQIVQKIEEEAEAAEEEKKSSEDEEVKEKSDDEEHKEEEAAEEVINQDDKMYDTSIFAQQDEAKVENVEDDMAQQMEFY